ncbi:hypothetical protein BGZ70_007318 [Mortierella alpina]|uniref:Uncharacterized protein n=1 Tax=Mortierella alpina TaxID=64518 RepID=A0A9P6J6V0_MORAP|nr:hypothetical protein BGZ70_007318 [Mortierella alpina]
MKFLAVTTLKFIIPVLLLVSGAAACPPDEAQTQKVTAPVQAAWEVACKAVTTIGGQADLKWVKKILLPYYLNKKWLTKDPPKGWEKELDHIIKKCHKDEYNYCETEVYEKVVKCVKGMAGSLMLKFGATAMAYCPIIDEKFIEYGV